MLLTLQKSSSLILTRCKAGLWFTAQTSDLGLKHRMAEVGRDLLSSPSGLQKQLSGPVCLGSCPDGCWLSPWWRLHNLFVPVLHHPCSKKMFPDVQMQPPVFQFLCHLKKEQKNKPTKQKQADKYSTQAWCSEYLFRTCLITRVFKSTSFTSQKNTVTTSE